PPPLRGRVGVGGWTRGCGSQGILAAILGKAETVHPHPDPPPSVCSPISAPPSAPRSGCRGRGFQLTRMCSSSHHRCVATLPLQARTRVRPSAGEGKRVVKTALGLLVENREIALDGTRGRTYMAAIAAKPGGDGRRP